MAVKIIRVIASIFDSTDFFRARDIRVTKVIVSDARVIMIVSVLRSAWILVFVFVGAMRAPYSRGSAELLNKIFFFIFCD